MTRPQKILVFSTFSIFIFASIGFTVLRYRDSGPYIDEQERKLNSEPEDDSSVVGGASALIDTSDWETYRNERFGFEIKYPPELIGKEIIWEGFSDEGYWRSYIHFNLPRLGQYLYPTYKFEVAGPLVDCERGHSAPVWTNKKTVEIGGIMFTRGEYSYPGDEHINAIRYYGKHQDNCYYLTYGQANDLEENVTRFEQIISTFSLLSLE
jgi:hypothetical protein